jgi:hypothetical protein
VKRCFQLFIFEAILFLNLLKTNRKNDEKLETNKPFDMFVSAFRQIFGLVFRRSKS